VPVREEGDARPESYRLIAYRFGPGTKFASLNKQIYIYIYYIIYNFHFTLFHIIPSYGGVQGAEPSFRHRKLVIF
jgi:hypothetical protein